MSSETTKRQIKGTDLRIGIWRPTGDASLSDLCQAKLALVQALEIQERMERPTPYQEKLRRYVEDLESVAASTQQDGSAGGGTDDEYDKAARFFGLPGYRPGEEKGGGE